MKRVACALAFAAGAAVVTGAAQTQASADPVPATSASGLQLDIMPPASLSSDSAATLDVNYRGGTIRSVELFVDKSRVFRKSVKFNITQGNFNLKLDESLLTEGDHELMVVATDTDGNTASSSIKVHVSGPEVDGIAQFTYPRRNAMVQNVVPIEVKLDPNIKAPYVAYLLDNDFVSVRNYAPYIYNWDSSKVADGPHTIGVEVYDSATQQLLKRMTVPIVVKNVGGFTKIQPTIPTIKTSNPVAGARAIIGEVIGEPVTHIAEEAAGLTRNSFASSNGYSLRSVEPAPLTLFNPTVPSKLIPEPVINPKPSPAPSVTSPAAPHVGMRVSMLPNLPSMIAEPALPIVPVAVEGRIERLRLAPTHAGNVAARPSTKLVAPPAAKPIVLAQYLAPRISYVKSHVASLIKTLDVAFNNVKIAFDVQPRIEHDMPVAPFRAIFEHTGGSVQWFGKSQTIRAVNSDRQIEFKIGRDTAVVNNRVVKLAYPAYVDRGRTIVPLSFVRDSMNVKVTYDARIGHLTIQDKR